MSDVPVPVWDDQTKRLQRPAAMAMLNVLSPGSNPNILRHTTSFAIAIAIIAIDISIAIPIVIASSIANAIVIARKCIGIGSRLTGSGSGPDPVISLHQGPSFAKTGSDPDRLWIILYFCHKNSTTLQLRKSNQYSSWALKKDVYTPGVASTPPKSALNMKF